MEFEVSQNEIINKYKIELQNKKITGWCKEVVMTHFQTGQSYVLRIYWDSHDGYSQMYDHGAPEEADRPEFEYVIDSLTENVTL